MYEPLVALQSVLLHIKQPITCIKYPKLFCHKILHVSGIFFAHHQELSSVNTAIGMFPAGYVIASKQSRVGTR
jgi:hypothetical protein